MSDVAALSQAPPHLSITDPPHDHRGGSLASTERVIPVNGASATDGRVVLSPQKLAWIGGHGAAAAVALFAFAELDAILVFFALTAVTVCCGHSVGVHRLLIHRSFETPIWVKRTLVWLGVLVGMAGPFGMIRLHDMRDWHQRQAVCPDYPAHQAPFFQDAWWQLCCVFRLKTPPKLVMEEDVRTDWFFVLLERTWMLQQVPLAVGLYAMGGWAWVLWGVSARVFVSLTGHWLIGHYAHRGGDQGWRIEGVSVQGYDLPHWALPTFGEAWHGNHHAFPHSARLGVEQGQPDIGYAFIRLLRWCGLAWNVRHPEDAPPRLGLRRL